MDTPDNATVAADVHLEFVPLDYFRLLDISAPRDGTKVLLWARLKTIPK
jgi:hypothetical protein